MRAASLVLLLRLILVVLIAATLPKGTAGLVERQVTERTTYGPSGRAERGSTEFPTPGTPTLIPGPATSSGGMYIKGLGTVSHASTDNNFVRLIEQAHTGGGARRGS
ncbi:MAG TPA: hypothetical protein VGL16_05685 [Actinomycetota bacterium]|jgi:hypothetical protein